MLSCLGVKVPCPGVRGAEGQGKRKGVTVRWGPKDAWNEGAGRGTRTGYEVWYARDEWARNHKVLRLLLYGHYRIAYLIFWRPITAIRNGDTDGNDATERDASWVPFIDTPVHPEYPCAHCILSATVGAVLQAEIGMGPTPRLSTTSPTAPGMVRSWA